MDDVRFWTDGEANPPMQWAVHSDGRVLNRLAFVVGEWEDWRESACTADMFDTRYHLELSVDMVTGGNPFDRKA
jgi:hypothetical protein